MKVIKERVIAASQKRHLTYLRAFMQENDLSETSDHFDPIDLALYISQRLQTDNDWLVGKVEHLEQQTVNDEELWL